LILDNITKIPKPIYSIGTYQTLFGTDKTSIKIISSSDIPNKFHTYCSTFYLIVVDKKYFKLSIKIITYDKIKSDPDFACKFINSISPKLKHLSPDVKYIEADTLAYLEIFVKEINPDTYKIPINIYYYETPQMYQQLLVKIKNADISEPLILTLLWYRELERMHSLYYSEQPINQIQKDYLLGNIKAGELEELQFARFTQNLIRITTYACFIFKQITLKDNFIRVNKFSHKYSKSMLSLILSSEDTQHNLQENINKIIKSINFKPFTIGDSKKTTLEKFIDYVNLESAPAIWYIPQKLSVIDYNKLNEYLQSIHGERDIYSKSKREDFDKFTNFYQLYIQDDFIHNIRHITDKSQVEQILSLLETGEEAYSGIHYSNAMYYQVFHTQIITTNKFALNSYEDKQHGFHNIFSRRFNSIIFLKQQLVFDKTMLLSRTFEFVLSECLVDNKLKVNKQSLIQKLQNDFSSIQFLSLEEITEILTQNNII